MKTRPKDLGTWLESWLVGKGVEHGLLTRRLAEGGSKDEGDVEVFDAHGLRWIVECKFRTNLNIHQALARAQEKSPGAVVVWKRLVRKDGKTRRVADGPPIVAMPVDTFMGFLARRCHCAED